VHLLGFGEFVLDVLVAAEASVVHGFFELLGVVGGVRTVTGGAVFCRRLVDVGQLRDGGLLVLVAAVAVIGAFAVA
jgi:hypothetical protein